MAANDDVIPVTPEIANAFEPRPRRNGDLPSSSLAASYDLVTRRMPKGSSSLLAIELPRKQEQAVWIGRILTRSFWKIDLRIVLDSNAVVSGIIFVEPTPGKVLDYAFKNCRILQSAATLSELGIVLGRSKFDRMDFPGVTLRSIPRNDSIGRNCLTYHQDF